MKEESSGQKADKGLDERQTSLQEESSGQSADKGLEERQASLQEEFDRIQKNIAQHSASLEQKEKDLERKEKDLNDKEKNLEKIKKDLDEKEKISKEFNRIQIIIPVGIYILMLLTILIFGSKLLILSLILFIGIVAWIIMTFQYNKSHRLA